MIKKSFLMSFTSAACVLLGVLGHFFLTRYLSVEEYGEFQFFISWVSILTIFSLGSFGAVVTRAVSQKYGKFFVSASKISFLCSFLASFVFIFLAFHSEGKFRSTFLVLAVFFPFYSGLNLGEAFYLGKKEFGKLSFITIFTQLLVTLSQIFSVLYFKDVFSIVFATFLLKSSMNLGLFFLISRRTKNVVFNKPKEEEFKKYGLRLMSANVINIIGNRIQFLILSYVSGAQLLAVYSVAQLIPDKSKGTIKSFFDPLSIHLSSLDQERSLKLARRSIFLLFIAGVLITAAFIPVSFFSVKFIFGEKYSSSLWYLLFLSLPLILLPLNNVLGFFYVYQGFDKVYTKVVLFRNIARAALFFLTIPFFEIYGIIVSVLLVEFLNTILFIAWLFRLDVGSKKSQETVLVLKKRGRDSKKINDKKSIEISPVFNGHNIIKIAEADYFLENSRYPFWMRIIAKLTFTKFI